MPQAPFTRRLIALTVLLLVLVVLAASDTVHGWVGQVLALAVDVIDARPRLGLAVFVAASILSAMLAFFSTAIVVPVAISAWGEGPTAALLWLSWLVGGCCSYAIGRSLGRRIARWIVDPRAVEYWSTRLSAHAGFFTILLFQLAVPSEVPGYVLGTLRYRFVVYLGALAVGELPFALGAVYLGESFLKRNYGLFVAIGILGIAFSVLAWVHLQRRLEGATARSARRAAEPSHARHGGSMPVSGFVRDRV